MPIRLLLAEDNALLREGLVHLFAQTDAVQLIGACGTLPELIAAIDADPPDVVITDIRMPPTHSDEGIQAARYLREHHPTVGVVVLSQYSSPGYAHALFEDGSQSRAYLLKDRVADVDEVVFAIEAVANGGSVVDPKIVEELVSARSRKPRSPIEQLTAREREILAEIASGKSNMAIATTLFLSERAIEKHSNSIFSKLGLSQEPDVNRRVKAVLLYLAAERAVSS
ncbi:MAG TPA: response regulator transcription factor [Ilumatobacteraceae bacterium]